MIFFITLFLIIMNFLFQLKLINSLLSKQNMSIHKIAFISLNCSILLTLILFLFYFFLKLSDFLIIEFIFITPFMTYLVIQIKYFLRTSIRISFLLDHLASHFTLDDFNTSSVSSSEIRILRLENSGDIIVRDNLIFLNSKKLVKFSNFLKISKNIWLIEDEISSFKS
jgi:hypothetical protein